MSFNNLPGVQVSTVDGGLTARRVPRTKSTLIVGTSGIGPANNPFPVGDRATAAQVFGLSGTLIAAMEEVAAGGSDNIILFRMGTTPAVLSKVGQEFATAKVVTNVVILAGLATVTSTAHGFLVGDVVKVAVNTNVALNGLVVLTAVTANTFSFATTAADVASGADTGNVFKRTSTGFDITFDVRASDTQTRYKIWYKSGICYVWLDSTLVFANDVANGVVIDNATLTFSAPLTGNIGLALGTGVTGLLAGAVTLTAAAALSGTPVDPTPTLTVATTGLSLTGRQTYIALAKSLELLDIFPVDQVYIPNAILDGPAVQFYVASDTTTVANNPATNPDALDWIKTTVGLDGSKTYQWASDVVDSNGATVSAMSAVTALTRVAANFYEASFAYLIADFCQRQEATVGACIGFIGTTAPRSFRLTDIRTWVGYLPTYDPTITNKALADGRGLLGNPYLAGCTSGRLNLLCSDYAAGYRIAGFYKTLNGQYDGIGTIDKNGNRVDLGAYLHVVGEVAGMTTGFAVNYAANLAGLVAGFTSNLDEKRNLTNKPLNVVQLYKANQAQLDALFQIGINVLRFKGNGQLPVLLHGETVASSLSDYQNLLRQRIKGLVVRVIRSEADKYIGEATIDGLQVQGLQTGLTARLLELQKRGYISKFTFVVTTTAADQRLGHANIDVNFNPADELIQLNASVGISRS